MQLVEKSRGVIDSFVSVRSKTVQSGDPRQQQFAIAIVCCLAFYALGLASSYAQQSPEAHAGRPARTSDYQQPKIVNDGQTSPRSDAVYFDQFFTLLSESEKKFGTDDYFVAFAAVNRAKELLGEKHLAQAEILLSRSLQICESRDRSRFQIDFQDHGLAHGAALMLTAVRLDMGRNEAAKKSLTAFLDITERYNTSELTYQLLAAPIWQKFFDRLVQLGWRKEAERFAGAINRAVRNYVGDLSAYQADPASPNYSREFMEGVKAWQLNELHAAGANGHEPEASDRSVADEAFKAAQYGRNERVQSAINNSILHGLASTDPLIGELFSIHGSSMEISRDLALSNSENMLEKQKYLIAAAKAAQISDRVRELVPEILAHHPELSEIVSNTVTSLSTAESLLSPHEALIVFRFGSKESYAIAVTKDKAERYVIHAGANEIAQRVAALRKGLDVDDYSHLPDFDTRAAHVLYKLLFDGLQNLLAGKTRLILVPDGALQSLPVSVLVSAPPKGDGKSYEKVEWLIRRYAISVVPSVKSLEFLRGMAQPSAPTKPFIGFGNPDFGNEGLRTGQETRRVLNSMLTSRSGLTGLPALPETANELYAIGDELGSQRTDIYVGKQSSVTTVISLDLTRTRVIAFATHGLVAGDLPSLAEPALALSPPLVPIGNDDGLLRASAIARLRLNADFVLLSACNTASTDGTPGAEPLTGLARAFFVAGARSLLVSHWPVASKAAVRITVGMMKHFAKRGAAGRAVALQQSILEVIDTSARNPRFAHPAVWGPFVLVGDGGAGIRASQSADIDQRMTRH